MFLRAVVSRMRGLGGEPAPEQVIGYELDFDAAALAQALVPESTVSQGDFFDQEATVKVDLVVGNPPYVRYHYFAGSARERGLARAHSAGVPLNRLTSSWAPFVLHAASFLKPSGRLALVLPAELLGTDYAGPIREFLLRRFARVDVIAFESRVFPHALVDAVLLLAEGEGPGQLRVHRLRDADELLTYSLHGAPTPGGAKWMTFLLHPDCVEVLTRAYAAMTRLGRVASVDIGVVTGANSFFVVSDAVAQWRELEPPTLRRLVARGQHLRGYQLTYADWEELRRTGAPVWLFAPSSGDGAAGRYIAEGERQRASASYKCRIRHPWWSLRLPEAPDLLLSYMSNRAPRLTANLAGVVTTNLIHNVRLIDGAERENQARFMALAWPNSATMLSCEVEGRAYGGGVLKLETRESERVVVPDLSAEGQKKLEQRAPLIDSALRSGDLDEAASLVDPIVMADLTATERAVLRRGWHDLRKRRLHRSRPPRSA